MIVDGDALDGLLERAAGGDHDAFARFYDLTSPRAYALARLADPARPEELLQLAYGRAWRSLHQRDDARPLSWLLSLVQQAAGPRRASSPTG